MDAKEREPFLEASIGAEQCCHHIDNLLARLSDLATDGDRLNCLQAGGTASFLCGATARAAPLLDRFADIVTKAYTEPNPLVLGDGFEFVNAHVAAVKLSRHVLHSVADCIDPTALNDLGYRSNVESFFAANKLLPTDSLPQKTKEKLAELASDSAGIGNKIEVRLLWERAAVLGSSAIRPNRGGGKKSGTKKSSDTGGRPTKIERDKKLAKDFASSKSTMKEFAFNKRINESTCRKAVQRGRDVIAKEEAAHKANEPE